MIAVLKNYSRGLETFSWRCKNQLWCQKGNIWSILTTNLNRELCQKLPISYLLVSNWLSRPQKYNFRKSMSHKSGFTTCSAYKLGLKSPILAKKVTKLVTFCVNIEDPKSWISETLNASSCFFFNMSTVFFDLRLEYDYFFYKLSLKICSNYAYIRACLPIFCPCFMGFGPSRGVIMATYKTLAKNCNFLPLLESPPARRENFCPPYLT